MATTQYEPMIRLQKDILFQKNRSFRSGGHVEMNYKSYVAKSKQYPENLFLVNENVVFNHRTYDDSNYEIYKFDEHGKYVSLDKSLINRDFIKSLEIVNIIK